MPVRCCLSRQAAVNSSRSARVELIAGAAGLEQQPCRRPGSRWHSRTRSVKPSVGGCGQEPVKVRCQRGVLDLAPDAGELAFQQIVVTRPQALVQHEERDERPGS